jgi:hypothetical protein
MKVGMVKFEKIVRKKKKNISIGIDFVLIVTSFFHSNSYFLTFIKERRTKKLKIRALTQKPNLQIEKICTTFLGNMEQPS